MLPTSSRDPSAVCTSEMPSFALRLAWSSERTCARRRSEIARPAASSDALAIRRPVDSRRNELPRAFCVLGEIPLRVQRSDVRVDSETHDIPPFGEDRWDTRHRASAARRASQRTSVCRAAPRKAGGRAQGRTSRVHGKGAPSCDGGRPSNGERGLRISGGRPVRGLADQRECRLGLGVRLGQHRDAGLLQDRVPRQLRGLEGDVDVADAALGGAQVLDLDAQVVDRRVEAVLGRAEADRAGRTDRVDGRVDLGDRRGSCRRSSRCRGVSRLSVGGERRGRATTEIWSIDELVPKPTWKLTVLELPSSRLMPLNSVRFADPVDLVDQADWNSWFRVSLVLRRRRCRWTTGWPARAGGS